MAPKILVTGAAGYIGGSIVHNLVSDKVAGISKENLVAVVRAAEQEQELAKLGISALSLDITDTSAVSKAVVEHDVHIILHTASSVNPQLSKNLLSALGQHSQNHGHKAYFIHTSGSSAYGASTGWPEEAQDDTGKFFETNKSLADSFIIRKIDVLVTKYARELGVTSFVVVPPLVYGEGLGVWNRVSIVLPVLVKAFIAQKTAYRFRKDRIINATHITDLVSVYELILDRIVSGKAVDNGERGFYFGFANSASWWQVVDSLRDKLVARRLLQSSDVEVWPSDKFAGNVLGIAEGFVQPLFNAGSNIVSTASQRLGWNPKWSNEDFVDNLDNEIDSIIANPEVKSSLVASLRG